ncbi:MAG: hypothetical protein [Circular genetic element sp.]|nr:MAG: hypothetical protein [Circular genetic element sp.]
MYYCYGQLRSKMATLPTNTSLYRGIIVFTASENPVFINAGAYWGGDLNEFYTLALAPPTWVSGTPTSEGTNPDSDGNGIVPITGGLKGGLFTNAKKGTIFIPVTIDDNIVNDIIVPPYYHLVVYPTTGTMTTPIQTTILGFDLVKP